MRGNEQEIERAISDVKPSSLGGEKMTEQEKAELKRILVKWIREDKDVYHALLDWAAFNPYIEFKW